MSPDSALIICRTLQDASSVLLWGAYGYLATLVPASLAGKVALRMVPIRLGAICVATVATIAALPLEAASFGDGWGAALDLATLQNILSDTNMGGVWLLQAIAAAGLVLAIGVGSRHQFAATALCGGLLLACRAMFGHAIMGEGGMGKLLQANYAVHVLSAGAWLGALLPLAFIIWLLAGQGREHGTAIVALKHFSAAGQIMVVLAVASGVANTGLILGRLPVTWWQPYQVLLAGKICLVGAMILLAVVNQLLIVPRIRAGKPGAARLLACTATAELALGAGALVLVNLFGSYDPV
jgi:putative copper resistance protein D